MHPLFNQPVGSLPSKRQKATVLLVTNKKQKRRASQSPWG
jgi:hypothetical protein